MSEPFRGRSIFARVDPKVLTLSDLKMTKMIIGKPRSRRIQTRTKGKRKMKRLMREANARMERYLVEQIAAAFGLTPGDLTRSF